MPTIERSITIRAPPAKVWAQLSDFSTATEWIKGMKECRQTTPGPFGAGTKAQQLKVIGGRPTPVEVTVAEAEPARRTKLVAVPKGRPPATVVWQLTPLEGGAATKVDESISFELPGLMKLFTPLVKGSVAKEMEHDTLALKKRVEG